MSNKPEINERDDESPVGGFQDAPPPDPETQDVEKPESEVLNEGGMNTE